MTVSAIRELLKVVAQPGMISLAGGIPAPESFPLELMDRLYRTVLEKHGAAALQYGPSEGFPPLRRALARHLQAQGIRAQAEEILISSGSQGMLDTLGMVLLSKGDKVAVESPTYIGALQAFAPYQPRYLTVETDEQGLVPEALAGLLRRESVKFLYLVPTFQNPTGRTLCLERRLAVAELVRRHDVLLVEDDPYSALRYRGQALPSLQSLAPEQVVYLGTLSKVLAPGLRVGYCVAPAALRQWLVIAKQGIDLHTGSLSQALAAEYLAGGHLQEHLPRILALYRPRQEAMLQAIERCFPPGFRWSRPEGGMFIWAEGPPGLDACAAYTRALARNVAYVPGRYFYAEPGRGLQTMRLNFTMAGEATLRRAVEVLAGVLAEVLEESRAPARARGSLQPA